ncbi:FtsH protease activity modulator HflK [Desulfosediminicola sp.]|uniref:FtsH protease activity modulator HflK n=1 Tax=Desulfosediminicola sp. TaxID=2886825 RepID=UPI003AF29A22
MSMQDQQPPWGRKNKPQTPEEMVAQLIKKLQDFFSENQKQSPGPNGSTPERKPVNPFASISKILAIILVLIMIQGVYSSVFKIQPSEVGVILRLGKYVRTVDPGLHFKLPYLEALYKVDIGQIRKQEFGFRTRSSQVSSFDRSAYEMESLMLTADKNVINVAWIVQYKISDPYQYLFKVKDVKQSVHDASESVTRRVVGNMDFDYVLSNRDLLAASVKSELQTELNRFEAGVTLVTVQFQDINPPEQVKPAFNEVNAADQDMRRLVNEAQAQYNKVIPKARGTALQIMEEARGYAAERLNEANGQTDRFLSILKEYEKSPEVTRTRMYIETMQDVLPNVESVYIIDENQQSPIPLLNIGSSPAIAAPKTN